LEAQKLVISRPSKSDARVRRMTLTGKGADEWKLMDVRSDDIARMLLEPLNDSNRQRLLTAMAEVECLLAASAVRITPEDPACEDAQYCIQAYVRELAQRFPNGLIRSRPVRRARRTTAATWLVLHRAPGKCAGRMHRAQGHCPGVGEVKRMWVAPAARRLSIARRLLAAVEQHAWRMG
jgi:ribosomal protein S18 acetylase RimI-like enzyme